MRQINWGIIGCGNVTELKSGPAFNKVHGSQVLAVMRRNAEKAEDYAVRHRIPAWYVNADELIEDPDINAVYIATPPSSHAGYAIRAMEKGKAVYVEKPMAADYTDCVNMLNTSLKTGMPLYVAYYRRYLPYFIKVKEVIESCLLGDLLYVKVDFHVAPRPEDYDPASLPWRLNPEISGGGYFYDLGCHQLDLLEWLFGKPVEISGKSFNKRGLYEAEDLVVATVLYESGTVVTGQWCFAAPDNEHRDLITVHGTQGTLEFSSFDFTPIRHFSNSGTQEYLPPNPENIQYWFIKNMVEDLQREKQTAVNGESAMRTNLTIDKILGKI